MEFPVGVLTRMFSLECFPVRENDKLWRPPGAKARAFH